MTQSRHSFSATAFENRYVYVYGGVIGSLENSHKPILASGVEKYDFHSNKWENISIKGLPNLAAFGYCFDTIT